LTFVAKAALLATTVHASVESTITCAVVVGVVISAIIAGAFPGICALAVAQPVLDEGEAERLIARVELRRTWNNN